MNKDWKSVPVPERMAHLERDRRGFPVPFIVARDYAGEPLFTINDSETAHRAMAESLCGICGTELEYGDLWWVGGPLSAFHPAGVYVDGPMHHECSTYALRVCPHLAAPRYTKRIDGLPASKNGVPFEIGFDPTVMPDRPLVFVQACSVSYDVSYPLTPDRKFTPISGLAADEEGKAAPVKWLDYEVWRHGELLDEDEGLALVRKAFEDAEKQTVRAPRFILPDTPEIIT